MPRKSRPLGRRASLRNHSIPGHPLFQGQGVLDGKTIGIIVEIDKRGLILFSPRLDLSCPLFQFVVRIVGAVEHLPAVEADINEIGGCSFCKKEA